MRQQVNLLNPDLLTVREKLDARTMVIIVISFAALLGGVAMWSKSQLKKQQEQQKILASTLENTNKRYDAVLEKHAERKPSEALEAELEAAETKLQDRQRVLEFIQHRTIEHSAGLSRYMSALSNRSMKGVWITGFNIDENDETIEIIGRALQPQMVAEYINSLGKESVFRGRSFSKFESQDKLFTNNNNFGSFTGWINYKGLTAFGRLEPKDTAQKDKKDTEKQTNNTNTIYEFTLKSPKKESDSSVSTKVKK